MPDMIRAKGFTLIEVLVATLVLTVGILGVAGMQMVSFQTNQSAYARSHAIYIAQDMFDRMRANPQAVNTTVYNNVDTSDTNTIPASPNCVTAATGCNATQMGQQDIREWAANFYNVFEWSSYRPTLPNGSATLARVGTTNDFTITVSWNERDFDAEGSLQRVFTQRSVTLTTTLD